MKTNKRYSEIDDLKNKIIDGALIVGSVLGFLAFLSGLLDFKQTGLLITHISDFFVLLVFFLIFFFRNRIRLNAKILIIIIGLLAFIVTDMYRLGIFSDNKVLIIALLFISFLGFSVKRTIIVYIIVLILFVVLAYLHISGVIEQNFNFSERATDIETWIINFVLITLVSVVTILIIKQFNKRFLRILRKNEDQSKNILEKEHSYKEIFNASSNAIFIHSLGGRIIDVNKSMLKMYNYKNAEDVLDLSFEDLSQDEPPYNRKFAYKMFEKVKKNEENEFEWKSKDREGNIFWTEVVLKKVSIAGEERILAIVKNIDKHKKAEIELEKYRSNLEVLVKERTEELVVSNEELNEANEELLNLNDNIEQQKHIIEEKEKRLSTIIDNQGEGLAIVDLNETIQKANTETNEIFGIGKGEIIGRNLKEFINDNDWNEVIKQTQKRKQNIRSSYEVKLTLKDGSDKYVILTGSPDYDEEGNIVGTIANFRDITERIENEERLKELNEELNQTNESLSFQKDELQKTLNKLKKTQKQLIQSEKMASLGVLSAGVAHEINNPLNFIQGGLQGLEKAFENKVIPEEEMVMSMLEAIRVGVERASKIVNGLSHFSREGTSVNEDCDIHLIIDNCITILHNKLKNKIELEKKYFKNSIFVKGNEGKLHQIFINIISNAEQSVIEKGKIKIETKLNEKFAIINIKDNGSGIKEEHLNKITDPFFTTKEPGNGTGLGLSIVQQIISEHSGNLQFFSKEGKGTEVIIKLPIK